MSLGLALAKRRDVTNVKGFIGGASVMRNQPKWRAGESFQRGRLMVPQYPFNTETAIWRCSVVPSARPLQSFFSVLCFPTGVLPLRCRLPFRRDVTGGMWVAS